MKLLPTSLTGGASDKASYILETSVVDMKEGWMSTESRNLNFVGVLSVVEKQVYSAPVLAAQPLSSTNAISSTGTTDVATTVVFRSRLGERIRDKLGHHQQSAQHDGATEGGWFARLGARGVQRSIESLASTKTQDQLGKSREGMKIILERLRQTGIIGVLELRKMARERSMETA